MRLVVVSYRVGLQTKQLQAGGLASALRAAMRHSGGLWLGSSGQPSDDLPGERAHGERGLNLVGRGKTQYAIISLTTSEHRRFYSNFANGVLWPLFHYRPGLIEYARENFDAYDKVNRLFAQLLRPLLTERDVIWVHDYHFIPLAARLRDLGVDGRIGFFLHTPLPPPGLLEILPVHDQLMRSLHSYDLIGFQTQRDVLHFRDYLTARAIKTRSQGSGLSKISRQRTRFGAFPISIEAQHWAALAVAGQTSIESKRLDDSLDSRQLLLGVDRLDYSKGLPQRLEAFRGLLQQHPEHRNQVTLLQISVPTRSEVSQYRALRRQVEALLGAINSEFSEFDWLPLRHLYRSFPQKTLAAFYRRARVALVTPQRDGMNLVAKEFVAAQDPDDPGVLILSCFAGAAQELTSALIVNPFDGNAVIRAMHLALTMSEQERRQRWQAMMKVLSSNTLSHWRDTFLEVLTRD